MNNITIEELSNKTLTQLRDIAKELDIKSISKHKKGELIELIKENLGENTNININRFFSKRTSRIYFRCFKT